MKKKIYVVGGDISYANFIKDNELVDNLQEADVVLFTGGEDVDPSLYSAETHPSTYSNLERDKKEAELFNKVNPDKQVCVGICRGSQFLCVMNGGKLVQDCTGHALDRTHAITNEEVEYQITSTHHQMQYPYCLDSKFYEVLYTSYPNLSTYYEGTDINKAVIRLKGEPEVVLYHVPNRPVCLAIQGHPEMMPNAPVCTMLNELINNIIKHD